MNPKRIGMVLSLLGGLLLASEAPGQPLGTAFTYQGRLNDGGGPASGSYDVQFKLFDAASGGSQVGSTVTLTSVAVANGLFTVGLDFGAAFTGSKRWLEIGVRLAGGGAFAVLTPRQELTPSPNATFASLAGSVAPGAVGTAQLADGGVTGAKIASGAVVRSLNAQTDGVTLAGTNGLSVSQGAGTVTVTSNATPANTAGAMVSRDGTGNFGAGTIALAGNLDLLNTSSDSVGVLTKGGVPFLHNFGESNTFLGARAGNTSLTGTQNTGVGASTLLANTTGHSNAAFGSFSLFSNTTGLENAAFGDLALRSNTTGLGNSAFGYDTLASNTAGYSNSAFGNRALTDNTTGMANSAFGFLALFSNTTGEYNAAFSRALSNNTTGQRNAAFGYNALAQNETGSDNAAFGRDALAFSTTGSFNTALGDNAGVNLTTGDWNVYIGNSGVSSESDTIRLGEFQTATFVAGISGATSASGVNVLVNSQGKLGTTTSSRRYKQEIADLGQESDVLMKLRPVAFYYKPEYDETHTRQYGLVAEEVAEAAPQLVVFDNDGAPQTVRYHLVNAMLLNEVQQQRRLAEEQRSRIQDLEARLARLETVAATARAR